MRNIILTILVVTGCWFVSTVTMSESSNRGSNLKTLLEKNVPGAKFRSVKQSPIKGLLQAVNEADGTITYYTPDGRYIFDGSILDRNSGMNLTTQAVMKDVKDSTTVVFAPKTNKTKHTITVFTDTDCGYCRKLHNEVPMLNSYGVQVRYMLYPRAGLQSGTYSTLQSIWCSDDQQNAMNIAKSGGQIPVKECKNPIKDHINVAHALGLRGTPMIITDKGDKISGYLPAARLVARLESSGSQ